MNLIAFEGTSFNVHNANNPTAIIYAAEIDWYQVIIRIYIENKIFFH